MFDIGWSEFIVIAVVALIAIGPKELPGVLRSVGHWMGKIRQMAGEFQNQFNEAMREAEMADLKKHADDLSASAKALTSGLNSAFDPYDTATEAKAATTTPPAVTTSTSTPASETTTVATDAAPLPAPPDFSQVAAMPDISSSPEPTVTPATATPAPETAPPRREAS